MRHWGATVKPFQNWSGSVNDQYGNPFVRFAFILSLANSVGVDDQYGKAFVKFTFNLSAPLVSLLHLFQPKQLVFGECSDWMQKFFGSAQLCLAKIYSKFGARVFERFISTQVIFLSNMYSLSFFVLFYSWYSDKIPLLMFSL